jgi:ComF family protein
MLDLVLDILFPQMECCICHKHGRFSSRKPWCDDCEANMLVLQCECSTCDICGKYLPGGGNLCLDCQNEPPRFDIARAVGPYEEPYRITTKVLKFMGRKNLSIRMGEMMAEKVRQEPRYKKIDLIVPVPISCSSLQQRGFNQTELLARQISKHLGIPSDPGVICRVKDTPSQTGLSKEERQRNLLSAFEVRYPHKVKGKNILLVDDVYTTGSTSRECTKVLLQAGAARVCVIVWASGKGI